MNYQQILNKITNSSLFKDSFWAVFGNGLGYFLLLFAGIIIARFLGKDIYGEYGVVKTTMFHIASFATLGLGFTATRFVAKYKDTDERLLKGSIHSSLAITAITSISLCLLLFVFAVPLANYLEEPSLATPFRFLGVIIIAKALSTTSGAVLGGTKNFKAVGINNIISGVCMLVLGVGFTFLWGLNGSLIALFSSQLVLCLLNLIIINKNTLSKLCQIEKKDNTVTILRFSFPVALQELSYTISQWGVILILTKYCSLGEVGLYTAAAQWSAIILFMPSLLSNVVLSYLSGSETAKQQKKLLKLMLLVNFIATLIPFIVVFVFSGFITSFYGATFAGMKDVMNILVFSTIFDCMCKVFQSNLISEGKNWVLFVFRLVRDTVLITAVYVVLAAQPDNAARILSIIYLTISVGYFLLMGIEYLVTHNMGEGKGYV